MLHRLRPSAIQRHPLTPRAPTPLDALIASHLYCLYTLPSSAPLRNSLEEHADLGAYVDRVLDQAELARKRG